MTSPLAGKRVVNTRALHQAGELDALLIAHGAVPLSFPCIAIGPPDDPAPLDDALRELAAGRFAWVALTSANTVTAVAAAIDRLGLREVVRPDGAPPRPGGPERLRVAVVGPATAAAVAGLLGWPVAFLPSVETAATLAAELPVTPGDGVLLPKSAIGGSTLAAILDGHGARVTEVVAYTTGIGSGGIDLASMLASGGVDAVCLTSPSTVRGLLDRLGGSSDLAGVRVACIGTETAAAAREHGLRVDIVPAEHTARALVDELAASFAIDES